MNNLLKFREYRLQQAANIQLLFRLNKLYEHIQIEEFTLSQYREYLIVAGVTSSELYKSIEYVYKSYYDLNKEQYDNGYPRSWIFKQIDIAMDGLKELIHEEEIRIKSKI